MVGHKLPILVVVVWSGVTIPGLVWAPEETDQLVAWTEGGGTVPQKSSVLSKQLVGLAGTICLYCTGKFFQHGGAGQHSIYCPSLIAFFFRKMLT